MDNIIKTVFKGKPCEVEGQPITFQHASMLVKLGQLEELLKNLQKTVSYLEEEIEEKRAATLHFLIKNYGFDNTKHIAPVLDADKLLIGFMQHENIR